MKEFFLKIKNWFIAHKPTKRKLIQVYAALLYNANVKGFFTGKIYTGTTKTMCLPGLNCYSCPGAVGACPLGSLQNALESSKTTVPAYVFGIIILFGLLLGRTICGFLCPVGLGQELLYKIKSPKLKKNRFTRIASYLKYVILAVFVIIIPLMYALSDFPLPAFCKYICPAGTLEGAMGLLQNPNNDDLFGMLGPLFTWKFCVAIVLAVASIFIFRVFCRFICPLGAIYGFFCKLAMIGVKLDKQKCIDCGLCVSACKMDIKHVGDHECINCGECISVCPTKAIGWKGSSLFLHPSMTATEVEQAPLAAMVKPAPASTESASEAPAIEVALPEGTEATLEAPLSVEVQPEAKAEKAPLSPVEKVKKRNKILEIVAWCLALVLLAGALVYYNVDWEKKDPSDTPTKTVYTVGDVVPDFTLTLYNTDGGTFNTTLARGKVTILNYWYTTCTPCLQELPDFQEFYEEYEGRVNLIAIHSYSALPASSSEEGSKELVQNFIDLKLSDMTFAFAQDLSKETFLLLGGKSVYPMTVVIDAEGVIQHVVQGNIRGADRLKLLVDPLLESAE